jgi:hypothetical protein
MPNPAEAFFGPDLATVDGISAGVAAGFGHHHPLLFFLFA